MHPKPSASQTSAAPQGSPKDCGHSSPAGTEIYLGPMATLASQWRSRAGLRFILQGSDSPLAWGGSKWSLCGHWPGIKDHRILPGAVFHWGEASIELQCKVPHSLPPSLKHTDSLSALCCLVLGQGGVGNTALSFLPSPMCLFLLLC